MLILLSDIQKKLVEVIEVQKNQKVNVSKKIINLDPTSFGRNFGNYFFHQYIISSYTRYLI